MSQSLNVRLSSGVNLEELIRDAGGSPAAYGHNDVLGSAGLMQLFAAAEYAGVDFDRFSHQDPEEFEHLAEYSNGSQEALQEQRDRIANQPAWHPISSGTDAFETIGRWCDEHPDALDDEWGPLLVEACKDLVWGLRLAASRGISGFRLSV